jgi:hypothetical protein
VGDPAERGPRGWEVFDGPCSRRTLQVRGLVVFFGYMIDGLGRRTGEKFHKKRGAISIPLESVAMIAVAWLNAHLHSHLVLVSQPRFRTGIPSPASKRHLLPRTDVFFLFFPGGQLTIYVDGWSSW